jgi:AraC-like DNA-binding protein
MVVECSVAPHVRGLLKSDIRPGERGLRWFAPPEALAPFVQHFWSAQWNVPVGERRTQPILPFPCANLVVMGGRAAIIGVVTRAAIQQLEGIGSALGAKLTPGALRAFGIARPSGLRDVSVAAESLLNGDRGEWPMEDLVSGIRALEAYLLSHGPKHDSVSSKADEIVRTAEADRNIVAVSQLADAFSLSVRSIQDVCNRAIGVSPKWLIRCFRLQDALERLETGIDVNLSALAQDLGYFDQAHFTRDFKQITGVSPGRY